MDYLCLTVLAHAGEAEPAFKARLTAFWSHLIRAAPDTYDAVFAEAKAFEAHAGRVSRAYMVEATAADALVAALQAAGIEALPLDPDDTYTKYEAGGSEWFQLAH
jgi:hypothetical protein